MKILSKEKTPCAYEHKVLSIVCDNYDCQKEIVVGEIYYDIEIESDNGESYDRDKRTYCECCTLKKANELLQKNELFCDLTFVRKKRSQEEYANVNKYDNKDLIYGIGGYKLEN